jgi:flavin-dependent dehydrogenase
MPSPSGLPADAEPMEKQYDVLIIGAGPSGSSAAAILAEQGRRVLVLEREKFPRYHIGESLLPFNYGPLKRLGLIEPLRKSHFIKKYSVQFVGPSGRQSQPFFFNNRYDEDVSQTWQVDRAEFDEMLINHARGKGAEVLEEFTVEDLLLEDDQIVGAKGHDKDGKAMEFRARMTLDCTGKESFAAVKFNWRRKDPKLNKVAVWTYYKGAKRDTGRDEGATTVAFIPEKGWFWYLPLHDDRVSVGVVADGKYLARGGVKDPKEMFHREVENNLWIKEYLSHGQCTDEYWITSEYTFRSEFGGRDGLLLLGDAFGFLDPVFSSGVMLALKSGVMAADAVDAALAANDVSAARFSDYSEAMIQGIENMRKLVYAFYDPTITFRTVTDKYPEAKDHITDCLSGDVNKDFTELFSRFAEFTEIPEPLPYGRPMPSKVEA